MKDNNYNTIKTIKTLIEHNISYQQLKLTSNMNMIESIKDRHHLVSILSQWNKFTFCDVMEAKKGHTDSLDEAKFPTNPFVKHIYDFNSQRSILMTDEEKDKNDEEGFNFFRLLKSNSTNEKQVTDIQIYHDAHNNILNDDMKIKKHLELSYIKPTQSIDFAMKVKHKLKMQNDPQAQGYWKEQLIGLINDYMTKVLWRQMKEISKACYKYNINRREHSSIEATNMPLDITINPNELNHSINNHITQTSSLIKTYNNHDHHKAISEKSLMN